MSLRSSILMRLKDNVGVSHETHSSWLMVEATIITEHVLQMPAYKNAKSIAIFLSMPGREVSTREIVLHSLENGKAVFVPYLRPGEAPKSRVMDMLQLRDTGDFQSLKPDNWGIPSLSTESVDERKNAMGGRGVSNRRDEKAVPNLDLIFMPAVAFDRSHRRLGHGKGFYDRYLQTYKDALDPNQAGQKMPYLVGLALSQQMLPPEEDIPVDESDWIVDEVVTAET
ncbi:5-formyltetrahydrofolate cyclo-ligase, variant [Exophiala xenobiotica]|uniref:5-formyltetrahydrofolate cyclo-ligase n=1 Tax=Exophiala xenobiotica TaxID=348802 RepID=A0A0D2FKY4_9EURO|nr:5-formyltetrahydrofolate cyclo-ligase, variant [Exophiala xenobiotica]KIW60814.1 5-formyltetrahydrofolate cyclo-ligase, variant [Exophiala xenobiotica]